MDSSSTETTQQTLSGVVSALKSMESVAAELNAHGERKRQAGIMLATQVCCGPLDRATMNCHYLPLKLECFCCSRDLLHLPGPHPRRAGLNHPAPPLSAQARPHAQKQLGVMAAHGQNRAVSLLGLAAVDHSGPPVQRAGQATSCVLVWRAFVLWVLHLFLALDTPTTAGFVSLGAP